MEGRTGTEKKLDKQLMCREGLRESRKEGRHTKVLKESQNQSAKSTTEFLFFHDKE